MSTIKMYKDNHVAKVHKLQVGCFEATGWSLEKIKKKIEVKEQVENKKVKK